MNDRRAVCDARNRLRARITWRSDMHLRREAGERLDGSNRHRGRRPGRYHSRHGVARRFVGLNGFDQGPATGPVAVVIGHVAVHRNGPGAGIDRVRSARRRRIRREDRFAAPWGPPYLRNGHLPQIEPAGDLVDPEDVLSGGEADTGLRVVCHCELVPPGMLALADTSPPVYE